MLRVVRANPKRWPEYLTGDHSTDFDLIVAACAMNAELAGQIVDRCLWEPLLDHMNRIQDLTGAFKEHLLTETRERASRYMPFLCLLRGISSTVSTLPSP